MNGNYSAIEHLLIILLVVWAFMQFTILSAIALVGAVIALEILRVYIIPLEHKEDGK